MQKRQVKGRERQIDGISGMSVNGCNPADVVGACKAFFMLAAGEIMKGAAFLLLTIFILSTSKVALADTAGDAHKVCQAIRKAAVVSDCEVNGTEHNIDAWIDTNRTEAGKLCAGVGRLLKGVTNFSEPWQLRIFSPFSGDHPLAICPLPQGSGKTTAPDSAPQPSRTKVSPAQAPASTLSNGSNDTPMPLVILLSSFFIIFVLFLFRVAKNDKPRLMREDALSQRICVQCYQTGRPKLPGSGWIELILWFCYLIPGLLYSIWRRSKGGIICPYCKTPTMVPVHSPAGQSILARIGSDRS